MTCAHPAAKIRTIDGGQLRCDQCGQTIPKMTAAQALAWARKRLRGER